MEIFTGDIEVIKKDIEILREAIPKCKNKSEVRNVLSTIDALIPLYGDLIEKSKNPAYSYERKIKKNKYQFNNTDQKLRKLYNTYIDNFIQNKEFYKRLCNDMTIMLEEELGEVSEFYPTRQYISENEMLNIILGFLKTKNDGSDKVLLDVIKEKRIFGIEDKDAGYDGYAILDHFQEKASILINCDRSSGVEIMTSIVHELGHIMDFKDLVKRFPMKEQSNFYSLSNYSEVFSKLYEKEFLEYLIKNNIYLDDAKTELEDYYYSIFDNAENQLILTFLEDDYLHNEKYRKLNQKEVVDSIVTNCNVLGDEDDFCPFSDLSILTVSTYSFSEIVATYLSNLSKNDEEKFKRVYGNFLFERVKMFDETILDILETTKEGLIESVEEEIKILQKHQKVIVKS